MQRNPVPGAKVQKRKASKIRRRGRNAIPPTRVKEDVVELEELQIEPLTDAPALRVALLEWYRRCHRVLPWRRCPGTEDDRWLDDEAFAYAVWVSEVMLQQTQVVKVVDYFETWMQKWPTVEALAKASLEDVRDVWAGLGYYTRAANLLKGAQYIVEKYDGQFPSTLDALQSIPGVGPYTSRAIASIAFQRAEAVVDGNVVRVLARLYTIYGDPKKQSKLFQSLANGLLDTAQPGDFNQALMELGATVCRPLNPNCAECPIQRQCKAYARAASYVKTENTAEEQAPRVTDFPMAVKKAAKKEESVAVCVLELVPDVDSPEEETWYLMLRRPQTGLLAGLWEFPTVALTDASSTESNRTALMNALLRAAANADLHPRCILARRCLGSVVHIFSHIRMTLHVELLVLNAQPWPLGTQEAKWVPRGEMERMGVCSMVKKVYTLFQKDRQKQTKAI